MRIAPNHARLRAVAISCLVMGAWWIIQIGRIAPGIFSPPLIVLMVLLGCVLLALGIAFWTLGSDKRAGVVFDSKGLLLNLGQSAAFIAWDNIERVGTSPVRSNLLALGSSQMFGIRLRQVAPYLQSYEVRMPASQGPLGLALRWLWTLVSRLGVVSGVPKEGDLVRVRARTGYDVLVPEALLGGTATAFVELLECYRRDLQAPVPVAQLKSRSE